MAVQPGSWRGAVGRVRAMEMMMLGEKIPADRAYEWGLVTRLVADDDLDATALELATRLAAGPTTAIATIRDNAWKAADQDFESILNLERDTQSAMGETADHVEGITAFLQKTSASLHWRLNNQGTKLAMTHELHRDSVFDLAGRTALITGASSGIGEHFARVLSRNGANLVLAARREDRLETLKQEIEAAGGRALAVGMDVTDEESTIAAFGRAEETFGTVDTIIANAGIGQNTATMKLSIDEIDSLLSINMKGAFLTAREGMRRMRGSEAQTRGDGRVILTSSITGSARGSGPGSIRSIKSRVGASWGAASRPNGPLAAST